MVPRHGAIVSKAIQTERSIARAKEKLGEEEYNRLRTTYQEVKKSHRTDKDSLLDGMIMNLAQQNLTNNEIRVMYGCGGSRITRIKNIMRNPEIIKKP